MRRWHDSDLRNRWLPAWVWRIGTGYIHFRTWLIIRRLNQMHRDHPPLR